MAGLLGPALEPFITDAGDEVLTKRRGAKEDRQACKQVPYKLYDEAEAIRVKSPPPSARQQAQEPGVASLLQRALTDAGAEAEKHIKTPYAIDSLLFPGLYIDESLKRKKSHNQSRGADRKASQYCSCDTPTTAPASSATGCDAALALHGGSAGGAQPVL
mmetsp:Transcript_100792/g.281368  ORF Transcript_100792/g.281368 Transcript_100792/m.281368 type:complete len:160 (-) Transcript_100792:162-641(-)